MIPKYFQKEVKKFKNKIYDYNSKIKMLAMDYCHLVTGLELDKK